MNMKEIARSRRTRRAAFWGIFDIDDTTAWKIPRRLFGPLAGGGRRTITHRWRCDHIAGWVVTGVIERALWFSMTPPKKAQEALLFPHRPADPRSTPRLRRRFYALLAERRSLRPAVSSV
jgi:hypothetical protein